MCSLLYLAHCRSVTPSLSRGQATSRRIVHVTECSAEISIDRTRPVPFRSVKAGHEEKAQIVITIAGSAQTREGPPWLLGLSGGCWEALWVGMEAGLLVHMSQLLAHWRRAPGTGSMIILVPAY